MGLVPVFTFRQLLLYSQLHFLFRSVHDHKLIVPAGEFLKILF